MRTANAECGQGKLAALQRYGHTRHAICWHICCSHAREQVSINARLHHGPLVQGGKRGGGRGSLVEIDNSGQRIVARLQLQQDGRHGVGIGIVVSGTQIAANVVDEEMCLSNRCIGATAIVERNGHATFAIVRVVVCTGGEAQKDYH